MLNKHSGDERSVTLLASLLSISSFLYYFRSGQILLYGDAEAHLNIARRVVDSLTPGPLQLGTVWLPLPHVMMLPFVWNDRLWQSGVAGSLGSMAAYVLGTVGIYRIVSLFGSRAGAWLATLVFAGNLNLLYMQSTAMTEAVYLAAMVWAVAWYVEFRLLVRHMRYAEAAKPLVRCAIALAAAMLTRYDGWFLAACCGLAVVVRVFSLEPERRRPLLRPLRNFVILCALTPTFWLAYNYGVYGNALEFVNGPYSAKAIAERTTKAGDAPHPGYKDLRTASAYFLQAAKLNVGEGRAQGWLYWLALIAGVVALVDHRFRPALLLWAMWPFYAFSIAYGGVPIFLPVWWPYSYYNARYGLMLLPAIAVFVAVAHEILRRVKWTHVYVHAVTAAFVLVIVASGVSIWQAVPICLREAQANSKSRIAFERALADQLKFVPPDARFLMYAGGHSGALRLAGIPFRRVVNEGNFGLWQPAMEGPARNADFVVAIEGDPVAEAVRLHPEGLEMLVVVQGVGQGKAMVYKAVVRQQ
ncbi:MAG: hypothetical protein HYX26_08295 [Acidobacteriales bacterium]|nr:hypothetical protein [Terriglobales bacterium]